MIPVLTLSVATAAPAAAPVPLAILVEVGSVILRILRLWIVEGMLFSVTTEGREMILTLPSLTAADRAALIFLKAPILF